MGVVASGRRVGTVLPDVREFRGCKLHLRSADGHGFNVRSRDFDAVLLAGRCAVLHADDHDQRAGL